MIKNIIKKIFLVLMSLLLSLVFIEILMRVTGFAVLSYQTYHNKQALKNKSKYTVMCIGESTTAQAYPVQMQKILNTKYPGKFSIVDCAIYGTGLTGISERLDYNIEKYNPDIAVCMMGAIDGFLQKEIIYHNKQKNKKGVLEQIKIYKLYKLLKKHIASSSGMSKIYADELYTDSKENQLIQKAGYSYVTKDYEKSAAILKGILKTYPDNEKAFAFLTEIYFYNMPKFKDTGYKMALKSLKSGRTFERANLYEKVIAYNTQQKNLPLARQFIAELLNEENIKIDMFLYGTIKGLITSEQKEKILKKLSKEKTDIFYGVMAIESMEHKDFKKAEEFFNAAEELRMNFPNEQTMKLYRLIVQKLIDNNIKVICMQYPVRSIKPLKNILKDDLYYDKITFISNELNFKQALKENSYNKIFLDECGGEFGHCTDYGNTLIAENVAKTLTELTK